MVFNKRCFHFILMIFIFLSLTNCEKSIDMLDNDENPEWMTELIKEYESEPVGNPPQSIWRYKYKEQIVYYVPPQCCDQYSILYDAEGNVICAPDGGFTGEGDGRCGYFFSTRTHEKLIWKDKRIRE